MSSLFVIHLEYDVLSALNYYSKAISCKDALWSLSENFIEPISLKYF